MIIDKITTGAVVQSYDTDTKRWVFQEFVAGDEVIYEIEGDEINHDDFLEAVGENEPYLPFDMVKPE